MRVGVVGSGKIGSTVAQLLVVAGHEVAIANSRGPRSLGELVAELGATSRAASVAEAAAFGEIVLVAIPLHAIQDLPEAAFDGKIVVDANNYDPERDGHIESLDDASRTSSELLAAQLPGARVVKAFNTMYFQTLGSDDRPEAPRMQRLALFVAGDDADAKREVMELIDELGFAAIDTGSLAGSAVQQPGSPIHNRPLFAAQGELALAELRG